jgi:hypothetical protein
MVTSQVKMRTAKSLMISFSGELLETVTFRTDRVNENFRDLQTLIAQLSNPEIDPTRNRQGGVERWQGYVWDSVQSNLIIEFLHSYETHTSANRVNPQLLSEFISKMNDEGELKHWTVALIGSKDAHTRDKVVDNVTVGRLVRQDKEVIGRYSIGRLLSPRDEGIDLDEKQWVAALDLSRRSFKPDPARGRSKPPEAPNGPAIRYIRGFGSDDGVVPPTKSGLLLLYLLDKSPVADKAGAPPVVAFGLSFPGSKAGAKVEYKVNNVLWEQEYGHSE